MTDWKGIFAKHVFNRKPSLPSSKLLTASTTEQVEIDVTYLLDRFPIEHVIKALVAEITDALESGFSNPDRLRYSFFIDTIRYNLNCELDEEHKGYYGSFLIFLQEKMTKQYEYDRDTLFLLWSLVTRKRWIEEESISDWMMEVVEFYFEKNNLKIDEVYRNALKTLSDQKTG